MTRSPGRLPLGTGPSPAVYGRRMNKSSHIRSSSVMKNLSLLVPRTLIVLFLLVSLTSEPRSLHGQDGQAYRALYAASERYYGLETLCAHFEQEIDVTLLRHTSSGQGTVCLQQPDLFSMRFAEPEGDLVVVDGEFAWTFYPSQDDRQVMRCSVEGAGGGFNFFSNFLEDPRGRFEAVHEGREPMGDGLSHKIALKPRETGGRGLPIRGRLARCRQRPDHGPGNPRHERIDPAGPAYGHPGGHRNSGRRIPVRATRRCTIVFASRLLEVIPR